MTKQTKLPTLDEMYGELSCNYDEMYHEEDNYDPEGYDKYLDSLSEDELTELWLETYGD